MIKAFFYAATIIFSYSQASSKATTTPLCQVKLEKSAQTPNGQRIKTHLCQVIAHAYPELSHLKIEIGTFSGQAMRFRSFFGPSRIFNDSYGYKIQYSLNNFGVHKEYLHDHALQAVLAHELAHTLYYKKRYSLQLITLLRIFISSTQQASFERATDIETIKRGFLSKQPYLEGLIAYKEWLNRQLTEEQRLKKQKNYLTIGELKLIKQYLLIHGAKVFQRLRQRVPKNEKELRKFLNTLKNG